MFPDYNNSDFSFLNMIQKEEENNGGGILDSYISFIQNSNNDNEIIEIINQKIVLSVRKIIEDMCFFEYKHIWNNPVNIDREKTLDFLKNKSISILKENIEKLKTKRKKIKNQ